MDTGGLARDKTLLDWFAGQALVAFPMTRAFLEGEWDKDLLQDGKPATNRAEWLARECYYMAQAMLREKRRLEAAEGE